MDSSDDEGGVPTTLIQVTVEDYMKPMPDPSELVTGLDAKGLFNDVIAIVDQALGWDDDALEVFKRSNMELRKEMMSPATFFQYLESSFNPYIVNRLLPDLCRLLPDIQHRLDLIDLAEERQNAWREKQTAEMDQMYKEEWAQREYEQSVMNVPKFEVGEQVHAQFLRQGGECYKGVVAHVYTEERVEELTAVIKEKEVEYQKVMISIDRHICQRIHVS
jgi:hypothetical protein